VSATQVVLDAIGPFAGYLMGTVPDPVTADFERTTIAVE